MRLTTERLILGCNHFICLGVSLCGPSVLDSLIPTVHLPFLRELTFSGFSPFQCVDPKQLSMDLLMLP